MLTNLTDEQKKIIDDVRKEFISPLHSKLNKEYAKESIETIFRLCGLSKPTIYIVDSPMAGVKKADNLRTIKIINRRRMYSRLRVEEFVTKQEIIVRKQIQELVSEEIKELFRDNAAQCRESSNLDFLRHVHDRVGTFFRNSSRTGLNFYINNDLIKYIPWLAFYLHFKKLGIENEIFDAYYKYLQSGIFTNMHFENANIVILIKNPLYAICDNRERLSNKDGYAIEWSDGYGIHFVNGVHFEKELYDSIFTNKTIRGRDILLLENAEQKAITIQHYGYYNMIEDIGAKKIGEMETMTKVGMGTNELYDFEIEGRWGRKARGRFVKVVDYSTGKITCLGVPVEESTETVRGAIAWTFNLKEDEYHPVVET